MLIVYSITNMCYVCTPEEEPKLLEYFKHMGFNHHEYNRRVLDGMFSVQTAPTNVSNVYKLAFDNVQ